MLRCNDQKIKRMILVSSSSFCASVGLHCCFGSKHKDWHKKRVLDLNPRLAWGLFGVEFACVGSLWVLQFPLALIYFRVIGVNVSMNDCLSLSGNPANRLAPYSVSVMLRGTIISFLNLFNRKEIM